MSGRVADWSIHKFPIKPGEPGAPVKPEEMRTLTTFPVKSLIARPEDGARVPAGAQEIVGVAFSGDAEIAEVSVSLDEGKTWRPARLEGEPGVGKWQVFRLRVEAKTPGPMSAIVRAKDARGNEQPPRAVWNPSGYFWNAWHRVAWDVVAS